jgi:hypothetical protein
MKIRAVYLLLVLGAAGCVALTPEGARVRVTRVQADVEPCASLGKVEAGAPSISRSQGVAQLRNAAGRAGGDTLLLSGAGWKRDSAGAAYRCTPEKKAVQPRP